MTRPDLQAAPARLPWLLGGAALLLLGVLAVEAVALALRPPAVQLALDERALGPQGERGRSALGTALCAIDLGLSPRRVEQIGVEVLVELDGWSSELGLEPADRQRLLGLAEALIARYDLARLSYDLALIPGDSAAWQLAREREHGRQAAARLLSELQAERFEEALFEAWDRRWLQEEAGLEAPGGAPGLPALTAREASR
jgi:hypothetical protein